MSILKKIVTKIQQLFFRYVIAKYSVYIFVYCEYSKEDSGNIAGVDVNTFKLYSISHSSDKEIIDSLVRAFGSTLTDFIPVHLNDNFSFVAFKEIQDQIIMNPYFNLILFRIGSMDKAGQEVHTIVNFNKDNPDEIWDDLCKYIKPILSNFLLGPITRGGK